MKFRRKDLVEELCKKLPHLTEDQIRQALSHYYGFQRQRLVKSSMDSIVLRGLGTLYVPLKVMRRHIWHLIGKIRKVNRQPTYERRPDYKRYLAFCREHLRILWRQKQARIKSPTRSYLHKDPLPRHYQHYKAETFFFHDEDTAL